MNAEQVRIPVGISRRLLGERVRYDGGHKKHSYIKHTSGGFDNCLFNIFEGLVLYPSHL